MSRFDYARKGERVETRHGIATVLCGYMTARCPRLYVRADAGAYFAVDADNPRSRF